jgi:hypothetical protein
VAGPLGERRVGGQAAVVAGQRAGVG